METIKSGREFGRVFSEGRRFNHRLVRVTVLQEADGGKVAFVAGKRLGNAVFRNRCKRVLREAARLAGLPHEHAMVILFATRRTHESSPSEVALALRGLLSRAGIET